MAFNYLSRNSQGYCGCSIFEIWKEKYSLITIFLFSKMTPDIYNLKFI
jgi:hypothetical protein